MSLRIASAVLGVCLTVPAAYAQNTQASPADSQAIRDLVGLHASASQRGDFRDMVRGYHVDADVRYSDGTVLRGLAEIEPRYRHILSGGATSMAHLHPPATIHMRFLRPDVAFVDVESVFGGDKDEVGATTPRARVPFFSSSPKLRVSGGGRRTLGRPLEIGGRREEIRP